MSMRKVYHECAAIGKHAVERRAAGGACIVITRAADVHCSAAQHLIAARHACWPPVSSTHGEKQLKSCWVKSGTVGLSRTRARIWFFHVSCYHVITFS